jgi:hypothetical protein
MTGIGSSGAGVTDAGHREIVLWIVGFIATIVVKVTITRMARKDLKDAAGGERRDTGYKGANVVWAGPVHQGEDAQNTSPLHLEEGVIPSPRPEHQYRSVQRRGPRCPAGSSHCMKAGQSDWMTPHR